MLAPSHIVAGCAAAVAVGRVAGLVPSAAALLCLFVGALAPDIDGDGAIVKPGSILRRFLPRPLAELLNLIGMLVNRLVRACAPHRGIFHAPLLAVVFMAAAVIGDLPALFWFGLGYLSHVLADALTHEGIPLLAPFSRAKFGLRLVRTGSGGEFVITCLLLLATGYYGYPLLPQTLRAGIETLLLAQSR